MKKIKLVLADVDGTLVPVFKHEPTAKVKAAIMQVQEAGVELTVATGRPYEMTQELFKHIGLKDLCIFDAGASIRHVETGEFAWKNWLSVDRLKEIVEIILPNCTLIDFSPEQNEMDPAKVTIKIEDITEDAPYVFAYVKEEFWESVSSELDKLKGLSINVHYAHDEWAGLVNMQITDILATKHHAAEVMRKRAHINLDETLAIGDSSNDVPLFKSAGVKVAMGNAEDELKELADFVVADVENDGFVEAMERFVLN